MLHFIQPKTGDVIDYCCRCCSLSHVLLSRYFFSCCYQLCLSTSCVILSNYASRSLLDRIISFTPSARPMCLGELVDRRMPNRVVASALLCTRAKNAAPVWLPTCLSCISSIRDNAMVSSEERVKLSCRNVWTCV